MITKSAEDAEREVEASRGELNRTMEALKERMTAGQLFDEAMRMSGGAGERILSRFMEQAKENPMPLAVMGVGLAWLMTSNGRPKARGYGETRSFAPADSYGMGGDGQGLTGRMSDALGEAGDRASDMADQARGAVSDAVGSARAAMSSTADTARAKMHDGMGAMGDAAHRARAAAGDAAQRAGDMGQKAQDAVSDLIAREPLLLGGLGLVLGLAIGAALPSTEAEDRLLGPARDRMLEKGRSLAQDKMEDAKDVAQAAFESAKAEVQKGVGDGRDLAETAERAVRAGLDTAKDQGQDLIRH